MREVICPSGSHIAVTQRTVSPRRHCEQQRDEAIHSFFPWMNGLLRYARNDVEMVEQISPLVIARSTCDEAIHTSFRFAEPVIGRAFARPGGSQ